MAYLIGFLAMHLILAPPFMSAAKAAERDAARLSIRVAGEKVTLKATQVPLRRILQDLAQQLHFQLIIAGRLDDQRSLEIDGRTLEETLKRALSPASWAFVYDSSSGQPRLAKVFVFPAKEGAAAADARTGAGGSASTPRPPVDAAKLPTATGAAAEPGGDEPSLTQMLASGDDETRALALVGLASMGGEQAIAAVTQALRDKEPWIRETAVEALAEIGGEQAVQALQQALNDENPDVQRSAREALARMQPRAP